MGNISSIHFKPSTEHNIYHNDRTIAPSYLLEHGGQGVTCSCTAEQAIKNKGRLFQKATFNYAQRTHQKIQAKNPYWSAVVNIKDDTSIDDLKRLTKHFKDKYGWQCYQIAIHRDEGHLDKMTGEVKINQHAHLEFFMLDENGINRFKKNEFGRKRMTEIQTETAQILGMERGEVGSKKVRLEHQAFRQQAKLLESKDEIIKTSIQSNQKLQEQLKQHENVLNKQKITKTYIKKRLEEIRQSLKGKGLQQEDFKTIRALQNATYDSKDDFEVALKDVLDDIGEKRNLKEELTLAQKNYKDVYDIVKGQQELLAQNEQIIKSSTENNKKINDVLTLTKEQKDKIQTELKVTKETLENFKQTYTALSNKTELLQNELSLTKDNLSSVKQKYSTLQAKNTEQTEHLEQSIKNATELNKTIKDELSLTKEALNTSNARLNAYRKKYQAYMDKFTSLELELFKTSIRPFKTLNQLKHMEEIDNVWYIATIREHSERHPMQKLRLLGEDWGQLRSDDHYLHETQSVSDSKGTEYKGHEVQLVQERRDRVLVPKRTLGEVSAPSDYVYLKFNNDDQSLLNKVKALKAKYLSMFNAFCLLKSIFLQHKKDLIGVTVYSSKEDLIAKKNGEVVKEERLNSRSHWLGR